MSRSTCVLAIVFLAAVIGRSPKAVFGAVSFSGDVLFSSQVQVGVTGLGTFRIDGGSNYASNGTTMGIQQTGIGFATVTDPGSQWTLAGSSADVGNSGLARLEILNGGLVNITSFGQMRVAVGSSSHGTVVVDGAGSLLNSNGSLLLSGTSGGSALLRISNGAIVNASGSSSQVGPQGRVELSNGLLRANLLTNSGTIIGSGEVSVQATSGMSNSGRIEAGVGEVLRVTGPGVNVQNQGVIAANGGEIEFSRPIINLLLGSTVPEITLRDGVFRAGTAVTSGTQLTNSGVLAATGGVNDFHGRISNTATGQIAVTNRSVMIFHDDVLADSGTIVVFPGSSAVFLEDLTINEGATLLADLAGTNDDSGFGEIEVVGNAQLAGSLQITLADGFTPQLGDAFPLLAASGISGSLSLGDVPELSSGLKWSLETEPNRVVLSVVPGLAGDYNGDGVVDGADYVLWRKTFGQQGAGLAADGNSNGIVDAGDYDFWHARVGNTFASGGESATNEAPVPEPASAISLFIGIVLVSYRRRKLN